MSTDVLAALVQQLLMKMDSMGDLKTQVAIIAGQVSILADNNTKLNHVVLGNGKPGHSDRLRDIEEHIKDIREWQRCVVEGEAIKLKEQAEEQEERRKELRQMRNSIFISIVVLVISTLVNIFIK